MQFLEDVLLVRFMLIALSNILSFDSPSLSRSVASGVRISSCAETLCIPYVLIQVRTMRMASAAMVAAFDAVDTREWVAINTYLSSPCCRNE